jgi:hypothetical protein
MLGCSVGCKKTIAPSGVQCAGDASGDVMGDCAGDASGDVLCDVVRDDVGVVALVVSGLCCSATISALIVSIIRCCFSRCCMSKFAILFLFVSHSFAIWCLLR